MSAEHQASARTRLRGIVAENHELKRRTAVLEEQVRRMERAFEEVQRAYEQYKVDAAAGGWRDRRAAERQFLEFMEAVMPEAGAVEARAAEARRQRIREFFARVVSRERRQRSP